MNRRLAAAALSLLIGAATACSLAPAYKTPTSVPATSTYKESGTWQPARPVDDQNRGRGGESFKTLTSMFWKHARVMRIKISRPHSPGYSRRERQRESRALIYSPP